MMIYLNAGGALARNLPADASGNRAQIELPDGSNVLTLIASLGIDPERRMLLILNGEMLTRPEWADRALLDGDSLSLMPPIKAG